MTTPGTIVVGGGLAGLAAAVALAPRGPVTLLESRDRLGGRAGSFVDGDTGQVLDACQHVSMGCCTNFAHFCATVGVADRLAPQAALWFMTPDGRESRFAADPLPAPFHLVRAFLGAHYLSFAEKLRFVYAVAALRRTPPDADPPLLDWLRRHRQTPRLIARFWAPVMVSALNDGVEHLGLKYARKVVVDGMMRHRKGFEVSLPRGPLAELYGEPLRKWLDARGACVRLGARVESVVVEGGAARGVRLRGGEVLPATSVVLAVPSERLASLLPPPWRTHADFGHAQKLGASPITSVHLWLDRPVMARPHLVLLESLSHWVFDRGPGGGGHYLQVVISASGSATAAGHGALEGRVVDELRRLLPRMADAQVLRARTVTEKRATFRAVPGVDAHRPGAATPIGGLFRAGDWTATGWPATMEGAVRSGYRAAEAVLAGRGAPATLLRPDLGVTRAADGL